MDFQGLASDGLPWFFDFCVIDNHFSFILGPSCNLIWSVFLFPFCELSLILTLSWMSRRVDCIHYATFTLGHYIEVQFMFSLSFWKMGLVNLNNQWQFLNPHDKQKKNLSLIFEFNEEILEIIGNEKDETKLIFEKYKLSLTLNISAITSSNCRGCFRIVTTSRF